MRVVSGKMAAETWVTGVYFLRISTQITSRRISTRDSKEGFTVTTMTAVGHLQEQSQPVSSLSGRNLTVVG